MKSSNNTMNALFMVFQGRIYTSRKKYTEKSMQIQGVSNSRPDLKSIFL
jgi:hypothetical protein